MIVSVKRCFYFLGLLAAFSMTVCGTAQANLLQGPHIIHLVAKKIVKPLGLEVHQEVRVLKTPAINSENKLEITPGIIPELVSKDKSDLSIIKPEWNDTRETLWFFFPGRVRSETIAGTPSTICIWSNESFVKMVDGQFVSSMPLGPDFYLVPLLFRDRESLQHHLETSGVDVTQSSLKRYDSLVCYVVGDPGKDDTSTLWVDKETFFPLKYHLHNNGSPVEIIYKNWSRVSRTWYPMEIEIFMDHVSVSQIRVTSFELESNFSDSLFNVNQVLDSIPK